MTYLIVVEALLSETTFHYQPYRTASSLCEAQDLMRSYMTHGAENDWLAPDYFALYTDRDGAFTDRRFICPQRFESVDAGETGDWLQRTGRA